MDKAALFKISYGLYLVGVATKNRKNGCIINTAIQVTSIPERVTVTLQKQNLTHDLIMEKGSMALSILSNDCPIDTITAFGMKSGRDVDKFSGVEHKTDSNGNPYIEAESTAVLTLNVFDQRDLGSHTMFFCDVADALLLNNKKPMTYDLYRDLKGGKKTSAVPDGNPPKTEWICSVCHYKYDGEIPFEDLPDDYVCPVCKKPKSVFVKV
ncbi:MAG: flavin reductase [Clostridiales bacterium]|nr:flavin reductase [Clostridiales bacterium]